MEMTVLGALVELAQHIERIPLARWHDDEAIGEIIYIANALDLIIDRLEQVVAEGREGWEKL